MLPDLESGGLVEVGRWVGNIASGAVEIAGQGGEAQNGPVGVEAVDVMHQGGGGVIGAGGAVGGIELRGRQDVLRPQAGDVRHLLQQVFIRQRLVLAEAIGVLLHIVHVGPAVVDDELRHAQGQGAVGAGVDLQKDVRQILGGRGVPYIDDDNLAPPLLQLPHTGDGEVGGVVSVKVPPQEGMRAAHVRTRAAAGGHLIPQVLGGHTGAVVRSKVHTAKHVGQAVENGAVPLAVRSRRSTVP